MVNSDLDKYVSTGGTATFIRLGLGRHSLKNGKFYVDTLNLAKIAPIWHQWAAMCVIKPVLQTPLTGFVYIINNSKHHF